MFLLGHQLLRPSLGAGTTTREESVGENGGTSRQYSCLHSLLVGPGGRFQVKNSPPVIFNTIIDSSCLFFSALFKMSNETNT